MALPSPHIAASGLGMSARTNRRDSMSILDLGPRMPIRRRRRRRHHPLLRRARIRREARSREPLRARRHEVAPRQTGRRRSLHLVSGRVAVACSTLVDSSQRVAAPHHDVGVLAGRERADVVRDAQVRRRAERHLDARAAQHGGVLLALAQRVERVRDVVRRARDHRHVSGREPRRDLLNPPVNGG